jgi:hypothetical protein
MADTATKPVAETVIKPVDAKEVGRNGSLRTEIQQLKDALAEGRQAPKAVALHELTKAEVDAYRKVRDAIRGALGIEEHPLLRRRALRRLAVARLMDDDEGDEAALFEDEGADEDDDLISTRGKLLLARRARRRRAIRRMAVLRLIAEDEAADEDGLLGDILGRRG